MKKIIPVVLLYGLVIVLVFGKALWPGHNQLIFGDDIHHEYYFYREFFNSFVKQGIFPWWNPYNFSGTPFIANPQINIWYPPTLLFVLLPLNVAYSWHLALHIMWAMTGMYVLSLKVKSQKLKVEDKRKEKIDIAAFIGGLIFGLSGFFMARTWAGHVDILAAASWMPWVVAAFVSLFHVEDKALKTNDRKKIAIAAVVLALQLFAGYHTMALFTLESVGLLTLFFCFQKRSIVPVLQALLVLLIAIGLSAIQLVPEIEFLLQSIRNFPLPYSWVSSGSWTWESLKQLINPFIFGNQFSYWGPPPNLAEHTAYVGKVGIGLAAFGFFGFFINWRKKQTTHRTNRSVSLIFVFALIAILGLWVSLGPNAPIDLQKILWIFIPIYHSLRIPPRHLILFVFGASILASFGFSLIRPGLLKLKGRAFSFGRIMEIIVILAVIMEMVPFGRHFIELRPIPETREDSELVQILRRDPGNQQIKPYRFFQNFGVWVPPRDSLDFDATMSNRIFSATGYDPSILRTYYDFVDAVAGNKASSILAQDVQVPYINTFSPWIDFLNIKYILHPLAFDPLYGTKNDRFGLIKEDKVSNFRLYENKTVLPRFFLVPNAMVVPSKEAVLEKIREGIVDPRKTVLIVNEKIKTTIGSSCSAVINGGVDILSYHPNGIELVTYSSCDAYLASSEIYYPGWTAYIDGKKTDIMRGNYAFRTLFIPAGSHTILFQYVPNSFYIGSALSVISALLLVSWLVIKRSGTKV